MKVTKTPTQPAFQPIELKITIESAEEYQAWKNMTVNCITNPKAMVIAAGLSNEYRDLISDAFSAIHEAL